MGPPSTDCRASPESTPILRRLSIRWAARSSTLNEVSAERLSADAVPTLVAFHRDPTASATDELPSLKPASLSSAAAPCTIRRRSWPNAVVARQAGYAAEHDLLSPGAALA
jgi:hypothetical protein